MATGLEKVSFHSNPKERQCQRMLKLRTIALISHASKVMLKILQARLQQYVNRELPMFKTPVRPLGWEDPREKGVSNHSSILAWKIPWTEEPVRLQSVGLQRIGHDWATKQQQQRCKT